MGLYSRYVVPRVVTCACGTKPVLLQRQKVVPKARGRILEVGMGAGQNIPHYDPRAVDSVIGIDPCEVSWQMAQPRVRQAPFDVQFVAGSAEHIPLDDHSVDSVLLTFALCTIPNPVQALAELRRVLRADGKLIFCEHSRAPDLRVTRWQDRINPLWKRLAGGCHINRDIVGFIRAAGFHIEELEQMYLPGVPKVAGFNVWGSARVS